MPKPNGYVFFLRDMARKHPEQAGENPDFHRLQSKFDPLWHRLSQEEKEAYKSRARNTNRTLSTSASASPYWRSAGLKAAKEAEEAEEKRKEERRKMEAVVKEAVDGFARAGKIMRMRILVMEVNSWTEVMEEGEKVSLPAEISVVEFCLQKGVTSSINRLVHHGKILLGTRRDMVDRAERSHKIEVDQDGANVHRLKKDHDLVVSELLSFLRSCSFSFSSAHHRAEGTVYVRQKSQESVAQAWRWLCRRTSADEGDLRVLDLSYLLTLLMRACDLRGGDRYWPSHAAAEGVLDDNTFDYEDGLVCRSYHQSGRQPGKHPDDPGKNWHNNACSLARARLLALNVCLHLLPVMGVELLPGMHKPKFEYVDDEETFDDEEEGDDEEDDRETLLSTSMTTAGRRTSLASADTTLASTTIAADLTNLSLADTTVASATADESFLSAGGRGVCLGKGGGGGDGVELGRPFSRGRGRGRGVLRPPEMPPPPRTASRSGRGVVKRD